MIRDYKKNEVYLLLLLSEVLSPKAWQIKGSLQVGRHFNLDSQAALWQWRMFSDWAHIQRSTVVQF